MRADKGKPIATPTKEYQSQRNKYTIRVWPAVGKPQVPCVEHWWDVRGRCVICGDPKPIAMAINVPLHDEPHGIARDLEEDANLYPPSVARELDAEVAELPPEQQSHLRKVADRLNPPVVPEADEKEEYVRSVEGIGRAVKNARNAGMTVIEGTPNTLLLDLDDTTALNEPYLKLLCELFKEVPTIMRWKSKSGEGTHVVLRFEKTTFTEAEAIAVEAALGSDLKRVLLYVARLKNGVPMPRVLFKPKLTLWQQIKEKLT